MGNSLPVDRYDSATSAGDPGEGILDRVLWYFADGSNLDPTVFEGRRRMRPTDARPARLDGWRLVFDLPVGPGERAVANVRPDPLAGVHGVAYRITRREARAKQSGRPG
jgi:hypothetical protein